MTSLSTLNVFRTPFLAARPIITAARDSKVNAHASAATAGRRATNQFVQALLRSLSTWAA
jgi:hypothetical protein